MQIIEELLPEVTDVESFKTLQDAEKCAFDLYREATILVCIAAYAQQGSKAEYPLNRQEAILAGLLNRIFKYMKHVLRLAADRTDAEIIQTLNRCILESTMSVELLAAATGHELFDEFVEKSLAPERELFDEIQENIKARDGQKLPIEERMLSSIDRVTRASGKTIQEINSKAGQWAGNFRNRLRLLDKENLYLHHQRLGSHPIHGTWVDLYTSHLEEDESLPGSFRVRAQEKRPDARILTPVAVHVLIALDTYAEHTFGDSKAAGALRAVRHLIRRTLRFEQRHEVMFSAG